MHIQEETLDDLLYTVFAKLLESAARVPGSRGDIIGEITGVLLEVTNPLARLSRTEKKTHVFSSLGELLWYLSGSNDLAFISYYLPKYIEESDDGKTVYGAYGPRLLSLNGKHDQIKNVVRLLRDRRASKRAVMQIFDGADIAATHTEVPCTCTLQFLVRDDRLHTLTSMRSNDAFLGLPHDVFAFTMLQELVARSIGVQVGSYKHVAGSLHLYERHKDEVKQYLDEGVQARIGVAMPAMPDVDPWPSICTLLDAETRIRTGGAISESTLKIDPYWRDLVLLLQAFRHYKDKDEAKIAQVMHQLTSPIFKTYLEQKRKSAARKKPPS
jgi:thymidylate synthase